MAYPLPMPEASPRPPWIRIHFLDGGRPPGGSWIRHIASLALDVRGLTVGQFPNVPLALAFVTEMLARFGPGGTSHAVAASVSLAATAWWAWLEIVSGLNWFRRLLGAQSAIRILIHLAMVL